MAKFRLNMYLFVWIFSNLSQIVKQSIQGCWGTFLPSSTGVHVLVVVVVVIVVVVIVVVIVVVVVVIVIVSEAWPAGHSFFSSLFC